MRDCTGWGVIHPIPRHRHNGSLGRGYSQSWGCSPCTRLALALAPAPHTHLPLAALHDDELLLRRRPGKDDLRVILEVTRQLLDLSDGTEAERAHLACSSALMALRDKIWLNETTSRAPDDVIQEIWQGLAEEWRTPEGEFWELGDPNELKKTPAANRPHSPGPLTSGD